MNNLEQQHVYKGFGLIIDSYLRLPEIAPVKASHQKIDVVITRTNLADTWSQLIGAKKNKTIYVKKDTIMFRIPNVATFFIVNGDEIHIDPLADTNEDELRLYILGTCMGAILLQRKILPLHGSAIVIDGKAYAIVGDSGAGKSTLASAFLRNGYQLLSDDVIPVTFTNDNNPIVIPAYPYQKLWLETLEKYGRDSSDFTPIYNRGTKFSIPVIDQFANQAKELAGILELTKTNDGSIKINAIEKLQQFDLLFKHTYRNFFIPQSELTDWHFRTSAKLVNKIGMFQIQRPVTRFTADQLVDGILTIIRGEMYSYEEN